jgi:endoglucanase
LLVRFDNANHVRPLVLAAHLDHPGFQIIRRLGPRRWLAQFAGGVPDEFFHSKTPLRLMPGNIAGHLEKRVGKKNFFVLRATKMLGTPPKFAVWELQDFAARNGKIFGRACDDLIGVACTLVSMIELKRTKSRVHVLGVISRAEEVGFHGALAIAASPLLSKESLIISLETSREMPPIKIGRGAIIRVGDGTSIFNSEATRFLLDVAAAIRARDGDFHFQRALMSGGTCEGTAYQEFGYQTAALCVALGNYHNCGHRGTISAEFVSIKDGCAMIQLLVETARAMKRYPQITRELPVRLQKMLKTARKKLRARSGEAA